MSVGFELRDFRALTKIRAAAAMAAHGHAIIIPHPVQGHIAPMLVLAQKLAVASNLIITFVNTHDSHARMTKAATPPSNIRFVHVSDGLPLDYDRSANFEQFLRSVDSMGDALTELITELRKSDTTPISCIIADSFLPWTLDVAKKFQLPWVFFWTQSVAAYVFYTHLPQVISSGHFPPKKSDKIEYIAGLPTLHPEDLPSFIQKGDASDFILQLIFRQFKLLPEADWILGNTIYELEREATDSTRGKAPIISVGPLLPSAYLDHDDDSKDTTVMLSMFEESKTCIPWLDSKPKCSVLYVSFGSLFHMPKAQLEEIAMGLLQSAQYVLWVVRMNLVNSANYSNVLPHEFLEQGKDRILVIPWSPQLTVLSHGSVGGFMSHCGWNSTLESVSMGVPLISFPQWSDQYTNRKLIVEKWKVGLSLNCTAEEDGIVGRQDIAKAVRTIIEGEEGNEMRRTARQHSKTARDAVMKGGSSFNGLRAFADYLATPKTN